VTFITDFQANFGYNVTIKERTICDSSADLNKAKQNNRMLKNSGMQQNSRMLKKIKAKKQNIKQNII